MKKIIVALALMVASLSTLAQAAPVVTWTYASADVTTFGVTSFNIERKTEACAGTVAAWSVIATTNSAARSATDTFPVTGNTTYCYRVAAVNAVGQGPYSNMFEKFIVGFPPAPTGVSVV